MKPNPFQIAAGLALLGLAPIVTAQAPTNDARVSLRVEGRQLEEVVDFLRERSGANIVILAGEDGAKTPISLELNDVSWREVLEIAAEKAGCVVEERRAGVLAITRPEPVSFNTDGPRDINSIIDIIAKTAGANIIVAPEVTGTVSLRLNNVPWRDALEVAVKTLGFVVVEDSRGILRVVDPATLQDQLETRHYSLRYLRPRGAYVPRIQSEFINGQSAPPTGKVEDDFPIIEALRRALSTGGELNYVQTSNTFIIRDTAQVHGDIKELIDRLDIEPSQVFIDIKFVSTTNSDLWDLGVDYGDFGPRISASGSQIPISLPFTMGDGGFEDSLIANDVGFGPFGDAAANQSSQTLASQTIFGALSFTGVTATLRMLQRDERTEVMQMPKLIALDGREATIFVGETIRYAEARTEQGQAGGLNLSVQEANGSPVEVGFQLLVRPDIIPGTNSMMLDVIPKETSLSGTGNTSLAPPGFDVFTVGAAGAAGSIALPRVRSSTIVTSMKLNSGETAVIGGLSTDIQSEVESGIPYLSSIPLLGKLFSYNEENTERRSLMVFITPTIVRSGPDAQRILAYELQRRKEIYGGKLDVLLEDIKPKLDPADQAPVTPSAEQEVSTFVEPAKGS
jgi:type IV pilus assembly protein PilQ